MFRILRQKGDEGSGWLLRGAEDLDISKQKTRHPRKEKNNRKEGRMNRFDKGGVDVKTRVNRLEIVGRGGGRAKEKSVTGKSRPLPMRAGSVITVALVLVGGVG